MDEIFEGAPAPVDELPDEPEPNGELSPPDEPEFPGALNAGAAALGLEPVRSGHATCPIPAPARTATTTSRVTIPINKPVRPFEEVVPGLGPVAPGVGHPPKGGGAPPHPPGAEPATGVPGPHSEARAS